MLLNNEEKNNMYLRTVYNKVFNEKREFKINIIDDFKKNTKKFLNGFTYIYGHSDEFGYYFLAIDTNNDGFLWVKPYDLKDPENGYFIIPTISKYENLRSLFYKVFNMEHLREELLLEIRTIHINEEVINEITPTNFMMRLFFSHRLNIKKPMQSKMLCQYIISLASDKKKYGIDNSIKEEIDLKIEEEQERDNNFNLELKKVLISKTILDNQEKYFKKDVSIDKLLKDINIIYFKVS